MMHTRSPAYRLCSAISEMSRCRMMSEDQLKDWLDDHTENTYFKPILDLKNKDESYMQFIRRLTLERKDLFFKISLQTGVRI